MHVLGNLAERLENSPLVSTTDSRSLVLDLKHKRFVTGLLLQWLLGGRFYRETCQPDGASLRAELDGV